MPLTCPRCGTANAADSRFCRSCATPLPGQTPADAPTRTVLQPVDDLSPGSLFAGRYRIIEDLGQGGMGRVLKALDTRTDEEIALKVIRADIDTDAAAIERFAHELKAARRISHRNVCRVYDLGEDGGRLFISMEYVAGQDLRTILRMTGAMSAAQAVAIAIQMCDGLDEAHRLGVVHRDLKPANILIDADGNARIVDFGIARTTGSKGITRVGMLIGTPEYMSPEQAEGGEVDGRSDLYSLGAMLFEMAAGRPPFEADTALGVVVKHRTERPPDPRSLQPGMPVGLSRVILRCLEKDRDLRYASAAELGADLQAVAAALPAGSRILPRRRPTTSREITVRFPVKRLAVSAAVLVVLAAAALAILPRALRSRGGTPVARTPGSVAVVGFDNNTGDSKYDYLRKVIPNLVITDLENTGLFHVATWERMRDLLGQAGRPTADVLDAEAGFDYCRREGVAFVVVGSYTRAGDTFVTECKLLDADTRRLVASAVARGTGEASILDVHIDALSRRIAAGLGVAGDRLDSARLAVVDVTTRSLDAYNAYLQGKEEARKLDDAAARTWFETAVRLDPEFAIAHLYLAESLFRGGDRKRVTEVLKTAVALSGRASDKERRLIAAVFAQRVERDMKGAIAGLRDLVTRYPREKEFRLRLGGLLMGGDPDAAAAEFQKALELDPSYGIAMNQLAFTLLGKGDYAGAQHWLERYAAVAPAEFNPLDSLGQVLFTRGLLDRSLETYQKARSLNPRVGEDLPIAYILALREDYDGAIASLDQYIASVPSEGRRSEGPVWKGILFHLLGRRTAALHELDQGRALARSAGASLRESVILTARGFLLTDSGDIRRARDETASAVRMADSARDAGGRLVTRVAKYLAEIRAGDFNAAAATMAELDRFFPPASRSPFVAAAFRSVEIERLVALGDDEGAIRLGDAPQRYEILSLRDFNLADLVTENMPLALDGLARALARRGRLDAALEEYRLLMTIGPETNNRRLINPLYHFRVAGICERKGDKARAADQYRTFLRLWKDADPGLPEPAEARKRLAALGR